MVETEKRKYQFPESIIQSPKGMARRETKTTTIQIPDLWHIYIAMSQPESGFKLSQAELVLECWHLCHDLLENINNPDC